MDVAKQIAEHVAHTNNNANILMIIVSLSIIATILVISFLIRNNIMQGVHLIRDSITNFVQTKELHFRISYAKKNEISEIVQSFNDLVITLEQTIIEAKTSSSENASISHELSTTSMQIGRNAEQRSANSLKISKDTDKIINMVSTINTLTSQNTRSVEEIVGATDHISHLAENLH